MNECAMSPAFRSCPANGLQIGVDDVFSHDVNEIFVDVLGRFHKQFMLLRSQLGNDHTLCLHLFHPGSLVGIVDLPALHSTFVSSCLENLVLLVRQFVQALCTEENNVGVVSMPVQGDVLLDLVKPGGENVADGIFLTIHCFLLQRE